MIARAMMGAGAVLLTAAAFAVPPLTYVWLPGVGLLFAGWSRHQGTASRAARRRRGARRGWLRG